MNYRDVIGQDVPVSQDGVHHYCEPIVKAVDTRCVCLSVCLPASVCVHVCVTQCICFSVCTYMCVYLRHSVYVCWCVCLSLHGCAYMCYACVWRYGVQV